MDRRCYNPGMIELLYSSSGFCVGLLVGMTGVGGGSLRTPVLILCSVFIRLPAVGTVLLKRPFRSELI